jgi:polyhydroxyalkanoate synthase
MWNYVVNNYLKGKEYTPFDLLYWNSDPTNVPGRFMREYVGGLYRDNKLIEAGGITVKGVPIDLKAVKTPAYIQAGKDDHIAPRQSCFKLTTAFSGEHRFMLAGSGHIAGVVNPPSSGKYQHWTLPDGMKTPATLEAFQGAARETKGSWWPDWLAWLEPRSGKKVKARDPGKAKGFAAIEDAPGRYVKERIA